MWWVHITSQWLKKILVTSVCQSGNVDFVVRPQETLVSGLQIIQWYNQCKLLLGDTFKIAYQGQEQMCVSSLIALSCSMTVPVSMWLSEFRANWMPSIGRYWHIQDISDVWFCNFRVFWLTKRALTSHTFTSKGDVQRAVLWWLSQQPKEFFADGVHWLVHRGARVEMPMAIFFSDCCSSFPWASSNRLHLHVAHISETHVCFWHCPPSWARWIQFLSFLPVSLKSILILSSHQFQGLPSGLLPSGFPTTIRVCISHVLICATCSTHPWFVWSP